MADTILKTRISLKYDTLANWTASELVLNKGEIAIAEIPTSNPELKQHPPVMFKVGVGNKKFSELDWASGLAADVYGWAKAATRPAYKYGDADLTGFGTAAAKNVGDFDAAGAASTAEKNAKSYVDEKIAALPAQAEYTLESNEDGKLSLMKNGEAASTVEIEGWAELLTSIAAKYTKPEGGIPKSDLASGVQTSLDKADSSVQSVALASGTNNGTLKLTVNGTATDNIAVKGLGSAAYKADTAFDAAGSAAAVLGEDGDAATKNTVYGAKAAAAAAQKTIDDYKTSNDAALAAVKKTADAAQTSSQVDAKISTHNTSSTAHDDIRQEIQGLSEKLSGRTTNYVYKNKDDAAYKAAIAKAGSFIVGDTIYFEDDNISDQWVVAVNAASPFYTFKDIETEHPSFDGYVKGTGLTAEKFVLGAAGSNVKASTYGASTTLTATDNANLPTSKAVADYVSNQISGKQDTIKAGTHVTIGTDGVTVNAAWPTASDAGYEGIGKVGTVTGVKMNGAAAAATSGVVDLGTVLTDASAFDAAGTAADAVSTHNSSTTAHADIRTEVGKKQDIINANNKLSADFVSGLGAAAKKGVASSVTAAGTDLPTAGAVASYVGTEIGKISIPTVNNAALKDTSGATIFTANASEDVNILYIDCGNSTGWEA